VFEASGDGSGGDGSVQLGWFLLFEIWPSACMRRARRPPSACDAEAVSQGLNTKGSSSSP
jgi:hypothetical protein